MDDRLDEILDRLRELDHRLARLERDHRCQACGASRHDERGFDEKRVIDTIVRLVCENVAPVMRDVVARELDRRRARRDD